MKILALDTSTKSGSVAIVESDAILSEITLNEQVTHSETLLPSIKDVIGEAGISMRDVDIIALTIGPGSFTGVRIGVSTVKGFAMALNKPVVGVSTMEAIASNLMFSHLPIVPVIDARRGEVYTASFRAEEGELVRLSEDRAMPPEQLVDETVEETLFAGEGLEKYGEMIRENLGNLVDEASREQGTVRASMVAKLGIMEFEKGNTLDISSLTPAYLRKSEAEVKREKGLL